MNKIYTEYKENLKKLATEIRNLKNKRKTKEKTDDLPYIIFKKSQEFRCIHVAMSLFRGKTYEQIENNPKNNIFEIGSNLKQQTLNYLKNLKTEQEIQNEI